MGRRYCDCGAERQQGAVLCTSCGRRYDGAGRETIVITKGLTVSPIQILVLPFGSAMRAATKLMFVTNLVFFVLFIGGHVTLFLAVRMIADHPMVAGTVTLLGFILIWLFLFGGLSRYTFAICQEQCLPGRSKPVDEWGRVRCACLMLAICFPLGIGLVLLPAAFYGWTAASLPMAWIIFLIVLGALGILVVTGFSIAQISAKDGKWVALWPLSWIPAFFKYGPALVLPTIYCGIVVIVEMYLVSIIAALIGGGVYQTLSVILLALGSLPVWYHVSAMMTVVPGVMYSHVNGVRPTKLRSRLRSIAAVALIICIMLPPAYMIYTRDAVVLGYMATTASTYVTQITWDGTLREEADECIRDAIIVWQQLPDNHPARRRLKAAYDRLQVIAYSPDFSGNPEAELQSLIQSVNALTRRFKK